MIPNHRRQRLFHSAGLALVALTACFASLTAQAEDTKPQEGAKPNIMFIMGDDIGWMQLASYQQGLGLGETPNLDRIANEGARFMHYYAEQSCTAGLLPHFFNT